MTLLARPTVSAAAIAAMLALSACENPAATPAPKGGAAPAANAEVVYACQGGETLRARYPDARTAVISFRNETFTLTLAESASGSRFTGGGREWWIKSLPDREEGMLSPLAASSAAAGGPPIATCLKQAGAGAPVTTTGPNPSTPAKESGVVQPGTTPPVQPALEPVKAAPCRSGDLTLRRVGEEAGAGQRAVTYAFVNQGPMACSLRGFATLQWTDADGKPLAGLKVIQSEAAMFGSSGAPADVVLSANGGRGVFHISFSGVQQGAKACPVSAKLQATPPGNTQVLEIDDRIQPCTGQVRVGPVRTDAGTML